MPAEWKKVIVSGSSAHLSSLQVGSNQFIGTTQATTVLTGSFTGSFSGSGAGLTGVIASSPNALTAGSGLSAAGTYDGSVARTFTVDSGSLLPYFSSSIFARVTGGDITITSAGVATIGTGKVTSTMISDGTIADGDIANATITNAKLVNSAITIAGTSTALGGSITAATILGSTGVFSGSAQVTGLTNTNLSGTAGITNANLLNSSVTVGSTAINLGSSATTIAGLTSVTSTGFTGALTGNASTATTLQTARNINGTSFNGSADITVTAAAGTLTGGTLASGVLASSLTSVGTLAGVTVSGTAALATVTVSGNATITGDLFVNGTTTQVNTTDLLVEDKFIILASGSAAASDGGIIIDRGSDGAGNIAFGFDADTDRWGYQNGLSDSTNAIVIGTNGNSAFAGYVFTEAAHTSTKPTTGEFVQAGSIYTNTDGTIWMYA